MRADGGKVRERCLRSLRASELSRHRLPLSATRTHHVPPSLLAVALGSLVCQCHRRQLPALDSAVRAPCLRRLRCRPQPPPPRLPRRLCRLSRLRHGCSTPPPTAPLSTRRTAHCRTCWWLQAASPTLCPSRGLRTTHVRAQHLASRRRTSAAPCQCGVRALTDLSTHVTVLAAAAVLQSSACRTRRWRCGWRAADCLGRGRRTSWRAKPNTSPHQHNQPLKNGRASRDSVAVHTYKCILYSGAAVMRHCCAPACLLGDLTALP